MVSSNKKGIIFPMENLVALILSIVVLFFLLQLVYNVFLVDTDKNLKVAIDDTRSMVDFVDYFSGESNSYLNENNCFYLLHLNHLENFQLQTQENKVYSYILFEEGIIIIPKEESNKINKNSNYDDVQGIKYNFKEEQNLYEDITDEGVFASLDLSFFGIGTTLGETSYFNIKDLSSNILLIQEENIIGGGLDNQNILKAHIFQEKNIVEETVDNFFTDVPENYEPQEGEYLVYSQNYFGKENILFTTNNQLSDIYVKSNLCSKKKLVKNQIEKNYIQKPKEIDYFNTKVTFSCSLLDEEEKRVELVWDSKFTCNEEQICDSFFTENKIKEYKQIFNVQEENIFYNYMKENYENVQCGNIQVEQKKLDNIELQVLPFEDVFEELQYIHNNNQLEGNFLVNLNNKQKENLSFLDIGDNENNCKYGEICEDLFLKGGEINFYVKEGEGLKFYSFKEEILRKQTNQDGSFDIYFLGEEILPEKIDKVSGDFYGNAFEKCEGVLNCFGGLFGLTDNKEVIEIKINGFNIEEIDQKELTIYLSLTQLNSIPEAVK